MDACTGKVASLQRVGGIAGRNNLTSGALRFFQGPLGSSHGGDNGSALLTAVSSLPAAAAVNDGARRGLKVLTRAGHPKEQLVEAVVVRTAIFATRLWRTMNGEPADPPEGDRITRNYSLNGVCAGDAILRTTLLALWQWIWPRGCYAVLQVQAWKSSESTSRYRELGAHNVMKITDEEKEAAAAEEHSLADISRLVNVELDRQAWRGEMAKSAYDSRKNKSATPAGVVMQDVAAAEQGIGQPLPPIQRDSAFKQGGWIASAAQQRRALALDGGTAVTKLQVRLKKPSES